MAAGGIMRSAPKFGLFLLITSGLTACTPPGVLCDIDEDCPSEQWCLQGACVIECTDNTDCPDGLVCSADGRGCTSSEQPSDGGPDDGGLVDSGPGDSGPDAITVTLSADVPTPAPGADVTLTWSTTPLASACVLTAKTLFEAQYAPVAGAPTSGEGSFVLAPVQDTELRLACTKGEDAGSDTLLLDVIADGTLTAEPLSLNGTATSTLSWSTRGAAICSLAGPEGYSYDIPLAAIPAGNVVVTLPEPGEYRLLCDGEELDVVTLDVARVRIVSVTPDAIGPGTTEVSLVFAYSGPGDCTLDGAPADPAGTLVDLDETTTLELLCEGFDDEVLSASVEVPQLISSFTGPAAPVSYGLFASLSWDAPASAACQIDGVSVAASPHPTPELTESQTFTLVCSLDGKTAEAEVLVVVLPGFLGDGVVGTLFKPAGATPTSEASLSVTATTSLNAVSCSVGGGGMAVVSEDGGEKVWNRVVPRGGAPTGVQELSVTCLGEAGGPVGSAASVRIWWGEVLTVGFPAFANSGATLVSGRVVISDESPATGYLTDLREVGAGLDVSNTSGVTDISGVERLERVLGNVQFLNNTNLRRTVELPDTGFLALREVGGFLAIGRQDEGNPLLDSVRLPALREVRGYLSVSHNPALKSIELPLLASVGGSLTVEESPLLLKGLGASEGFPSLLTVAGSFTWVKTGLSSITEYFPQLSSRGGDTFQVRQNTNLPCLNVEIFYCQTGGGPVVYIVPSNEAACSNDEPTCP